MYYYFSLLHVHIQYDVATSRGYKIMRIIAVGFEKEPFFLSLREAVPVGRVWFSSSVGWEWVRKSIASTLLRRQVPSGTYSTLKFT